MNIVFAIPSKRRPEECQHLLDQWLERGYRVVLRRLNSDAPHPKRCELVLRDYYPGWASSVNELCGLLLKDPNVEWIVTGGDDYGPDLACYAEKIAGECAAHFCGTFGVMQPTGDRWGADEEWAQRMFPAAPAMIDRICGSPWMGREFCRRMYGGAGPFCGRYPHMHADEELQCVAKKLGVLWQRRDLTQFHHHWGRQPGANLRTKLGCPEWLKWANSPEHWDHSRALFVTRKAAGFPGHEPLAI